jgi:cell division protein FtsB
MAVRADRLRHNIADSIPWPDQAGRRRSSSSAKEMLGRVVIPQHVVVFMIAAAIVCSVSLLYLVQTSAVANKAYRIEQYKAQNEVLIRENEAFRLQIAQFESLSVVEQTAREKLGMQPVTNVEYLPVPAWVISSGDSGSGQ